MMRQWNNIKRLLLSPAGNQDCRNDDKLHLILPDGLMILEENEILTVRNASLLEGLNFCYRDSDRLVFAGNYRLVIVSIPKPGEAVNTL